MMVRNLVCDGVACSECDGVACSDVMARHVVCDGEVVVCDGEVVVCVMVRYVVCDGEACSV